MRKIIFLILLALSLQFIPSTTWASRVPSAKGSHGTVLHFFKKYGGKYKASVFGTNKIVRVEIGAVEEQAKNLAQIESLVTLSNGQTAHVLLSFKKSFPLGWRVKSWEMLELR